MKLDTVRKKIDTLDNNLLNLLQNRFKLVQQISELKRKLRLPVEDKKREQEVLNTFLRKGEKLELSNYFIRQLFNLIMKESKKIQRKL